MKTKDDIIEYRINQAKDAVEQAEIMFNNGFLPITINRLYYSLFYAVTAALLKKDIKSKTHSGTRIQFHNTFIKPGYLQKTFSDLYNYLFDKRQDSDYGEFFTISKEDTQKLIEESKDNLTVLINFIPTIE